MLLKPLFEHHQYPHNFPMIRRMATTVVVDDGVEKGWREDAARL